MKATPPASLMKPVAAPAVMLERALMVEPAAMVERLRQTV